MFWGRGTANISEHPPGYTVRGRVCMHQWGRGGEDNRCCVHPCLGKLTLVLDARLSLPCTTPDQLLTRHALGRCPGRPAMCCRMQAPAPPVPRAPLPAELPALWRLSCWPQVGRACTLCGTSPNRWFPCRDGWAQMGSVTISPFSLVNGHASIPSALQASCCGGGAGAGGSPPSSCLTIQTRLAKS